MKFEYRLVESGLANDRIERVEANMNALGDEGWEMVGVCGVHGQTFIFMRQIASPATKVPKKK